MNYLQEIYSRAISKNAEIKYLFENGSLRMTNHNMPLSIKNDEFIFLKDFVVQNNLRRGYEIATAFGISATAFGLGLKETGGKIVTMDSYIEEQYNDCSVYRNKKAIYEQSDGFKSVNFLVEEFSLTNIVYPKVGWSPDDTDRIIKEVFDNQKLDFVFIDALHYDEAVIADVNSILPFLDDKFVIFFHDVHCFSKNVEKFLIETFNQSWTIPSQCKYIAGSPRGGYNLGYIFNA